MNSSETRKASSQSQESTPGRLASLQPHTSILFPFILTAVLVLGFASHSVAAIVSEPMTGATAPNWVIGGSAFLTGSTGIDTVGDGWLRLTDPGLNEAGYAFFDSPFDISQGAIIQFDYATWGGTGADGYSVYLFDSSYNASNFSVGASGGSLGYAQKNPPATPANIGLSGGYIGVGIDEYGNYSNPSEGRVGGTSQQPNEVGVRGPTANDPTGSTGYPWLGGTGSLAAAQSLWFNQGYRPIQSGAQYRKVIIFLTPVAAPNYLRVDVYMQYGFNQIMTPLVNGLFTGQPVPSSVKIGYAASTGGSTNYHEIRNLIIDPMPDLDLGITKISTSPTPTQGGPLTYVINAFNYGPNGATASNVPITDSMPSQLTVGATWTCSGFGGATCGAVSGSGNINTTVNLPFNSRATFTVTGTVSIATTPGTQFTNTASLSAPSGVTDYNPANNSASATVTVTSNLVTLSGTIYSDVNHNGVYDAGDTTTGIATIYAKLFRTSNMTTALQAVPYTAATGAYSFANVPSYDNYTIILSTNNTLTDPTPIDPNANWIYTSPANYTLSNIAVGPANVTGLNFGLYNGSRVSGKVINDNGLNGALTNANDGVLNAAETGIAGVTVSLWNSGKTTQYDTTTTDSGGNFALYTNTASVNPLLIYESNLANYVSVNYNAGNTAGTYSIANDSISFNYTRYGNNATGGYRNILFSDVLNNTFLPTPLAQNNNANTSIYYAHTFTPNTGGLVTFSTNSRSQGTWPAVVYYQDTNCNGSYDGGDTILSGAISASAGTPICVLVKDTIPAGALLGTTDQIISVATFSFARSVLTTNSTYTVIDTTTVAPPGPTVTVSGTVFNDANSNGVRDGGEASPNLSGIYAKLFAASDLTTALSVTAVVQSAGTYTFTLVPTNAAYVIILSGTNSTSNDPSFPSAQWVYTSPNNYRIANVLVGGSNLSNQNFGVFNGTRIDGMTLKDDGAATGSNANNGVQNPGETGISGQTMSVCDNSSCTSINTAVTDANGLYSLFVPWATNFAIARITQTTMPPGYSMITYNPGGATGSAANLGGRSVTFTFTRGTNITGLVHSDVPDNVFAPTPLAQGVAQTASVYYAHTFTPGTGGLVSFTTNSRSQSSWPALAYYQDTNCNGVYDGGDIVLPVSLSATAGTPVCILVKDTVLSTAAAGATDQVVTRATFTYTNSYGPLVGTFDVIDTTTALAPNLSTSTKTWTDLSGGPGGSNVYSGDVLQYTITLINSAATATAYGVQVTDTISANLSSLLVMSIPAGAADFSTATTLDIRTIVVPPGGTVTIVFNATVAAASGTVPNTANITLPSGAGPAVSSTAATIVTFVGNKPLYLYNLTSSLSRTAPTTQPAPSYVTIASGGTVTWILSPPLASSVTISVPVTVNLYTSRDANNVNRGVVVNLSCSATPAVFISQTQTYTPPAAPTLRAFTLSGAFSSMTCGAGNSWVLAVTNNTAGQNLRISAGLTYPSQVVLQTQNLIAVNSLNAYIATWPSTTQSSGNNYVRGASVYLRPVVSDPFGAFDITSAAITIKDPNNNTVVSAATLTNIVSSTSGTNTYEYRYTVPAGGTTGVWTYSVLAREGTENTVSDTGVNTFRVYLPNLLVVKSSTVWSDPVSGTTVTASPKAIPGAVMTYAITVTNSDPLTADNVTITDSLAPEITAGHLAFNTRYVDATYNCAAGSGIVVNGVCNTNASDADNANWNITTPNAVTVAGLSIPSGGSATILFQAIIQ